MTVAECDSKGRVSGPVLSGTARVVGPRAAIAGPLFDEKYGAVSRVWRRFHTLVRWLGLGHQWLYVEIDLDGGRSG